MQIRHKKLFSLLTVFLAIGSIFLGKNLIFAYSQNCVDEKKYIETRQTILTQCITQCEKDKTTGNEEVSTNCATESCSNESENLTIAKDSYSDCSAPPPVKDALPQTNSSQSMPSQTNPSQEGHPDSSVIVPLANLDIYIAALNDSLRFDSQETVSTKSIIQKYCLALQQNPSFAASDFVYTSQQSAFVFLLCNHVDKVSGFDATKFFQGTKLPQNKGIFKATSFSGIGISSEKCSSSTSMNDCDLSKILPPIYSSILNDYTNLKEASLYGVTMSSLSKEDLITLSNTFAANYTLSSPLCGGTSQYPKTCHIMNQYLQSAAKSFVTTKIFYSSALVDWASSLTPSSCSFGSPGYSLIPCGLFADRINSLQGFTALLYNEALYYRLFINYYTLILTANPQIISSSSELISRDLFQKKTRFANELQRSQKALSSTIRSLRDIYAAFPLHIGFMMYQEDLISFGKRFATLVEPLYLLYDKLRNVQQP